jgi:Ca2+-binding EF-hand superfamily protein
MMTRRIWTLVLIGAALGACSLIDSTPPGPGRGEERPRPAKPILSPNAEPLTGGALGQRPCREALDGWVARIDTDHDGRISRAEFLADARAQFARMDLDQDGFITADELSTYRDPFLPHEEPAPLRRPRPEGGPGQPPAGGPGREPSGPTATADPVMSADTNLDFKVSLDEFLRQATALFDSLDIDHSGTLDSGKVTRRCPVVPA